MRLFVLARQAVGVCQVTDPRFYAARTVAINAGGLPPLRFLAPPAATELVLGPRCDRETVGAWACRFPHLGALVLDAAVGPPDVETVLAQLWLRADAAVYLPPRLYAAAQSGGWPRGRPALVRPMGLRERRHVERCSRC